MIDDIVQKIYLSIKDNIDLSWSNLEKIRYIYLAIGKLIEKNTDFFLNEKLADLKLSDDELFAVYKDNDINVRKYDGGEQYQVICKSAAYIQKEVLNKFGIKAEYVVTCGNEDEIRHWFLAVVDNENQYFLTLAADLPYIKNNLPTYHFASSISLFRSNTINKEKLKSNLFNYYLVKKDDNCFLITKNDYKYINITDKNCVVYDLNEKLYDILPNEVEYVVRSYDINQNLKTRKNTKEINGIEFEFEEIAYTNLNIAGSQTLSNIDNKIGYGSAYQELEYLTDKNFKEMFYILKEENSKIYQIFNDSLGISDDLSISFDEVTENKVNKLCYNFNRYIAAFLNQKYSSNNFTEDNILKELLKINNLECSSEEDIDKNIKKLKKDKKGTNDGELISNILSIFIIEDMFKELINLKKEINYLDNNIRVMLYDYNKTEMTDKGLASQIYYDNKKRLDLEKELDKLKTKLSISKLSPMLNRIAFYFVNNDKYEIPAVYSDTKEFIPQKYIIEKFCLMIPTVLDINCGNIKTNSHTSFSVQGYSEQVVIIKNLLIRIFNELNEDNCSKLTNYNSGYAPILNRIRVCPVKNIQTGEYAICFRFWATENEDEKELIYIPSQNKIVNFDILSDSNKYMYVSTSIDKKIDELEEIEDTNIIR